MPGMALDPQHCLPPGIIQRGRAAHADPVCSSWVHFDKTLHKLLQGYTMMYSECVKVNGTRSNVFPLSFHVFDINSTRTASASSSLRAFGPMTPLGLWHPRRLR